ncbi:hypothetical protein CPB83DRAFT_899848 [Crepidotus variabilis]|uniref:DUF6533 domain-containing protein n=1 Tax=Crepidotus variabilis TaxID=179855 RepID=A0A9P6E459_9AGAR|nr:hypothetical protein CPB83DRAFT_899848 [Crepidotus variabilis]
MISHLLLAAESTAKAEANIILRYNVQFASIALLYYDYTLTWTREVKHFWLRKPTLSSVLYLFCRYGMLANVIYTIAVTGKLKALRLCSAIGVAGRVGILAVWGVRTYAIFDKHRGILAFFAALGLARLAFAIIHVPFVSCVENAQDPLGSVPSQLLAIITAVYEILSALVTTIRCYQILKITETLQSTRKTLTHIVLHQGLLYIACVTVFTVGTIALYNVEGAMFAPLLNAFTLPISGMMTCRFLLHLREWEHSSSYFDSMGDDPESILDCPLEFQTAANCNMRRTSWSEELRCDPLLRFADRHTDEELPGPDRV